MEENKSIIRSPYEADNTKDLSILDEVISPDFFDPTLKLHGPESYKQFESMFFQGFSDWHETIEDIIAEEDKVLLVLQAPEHTKENGEGSLPQEKILQSQVFKSGAYSTAKS